MNVLIFGDVVGKSGRTALSYYLPQLINKYNADFVIVNGENSAHGKGITPRIYHSFIELGVDVITLGNHAFSKQTILDNIEDLNRLVFPNNHPFAPNSNGDKLFSINDMKLRIINILGDVFMAPEPSESCFKAMARIMDSVSDDECVIVDFHGEATAEKRAFFEMFKSRCSLIYGTHTHVQTADEMIKDGCAFISDVGMVGAYDSVLGRDIKESLQLYKGKRTRYLPSDNPALCCALFVSIDNQSKQATSIERIQIRP